MKKFFTLFIFASLTMVLWGQARGFINNGSYVLISEEGYLKIEGPNGHFINKDNGKIDLEGSIHISGDWDNQSATENIFINQSDGSVVFNGTTPAQTIWNKTLFNNLHIRNATGVVIDEELSVKNFYIEDGGRVDGNGRDIFIYGDWHSTTGLFKHNHSHIYFKGNSNQEINTILNQEFYEITIDNDNILFINNAFSVNNFYITSGIAESVGNADIEAKLVYNGDSEQSTGHEWPLVSSFDVYIENTSPGGVSLNGNKEIAAGKNLVVQGKLNMNDNTINGLGNFIVEDGATLATSHTSGLDGNLLLSGTKSLSKLAGYEFTGNSNQVTGGLLPDTVTSLRINTGTPETTVELSRAGLTIISDALIVDNGTLAVPAESQLSVNGASLFNSPISLKLKADISGTASFIDNGSILGGGWAACETFLREELAPEHFGNYISMPISNGHSTMFESPASGLWQFNAGEASWQITDDEWLDIMTGYTVKYNDAKLLTFTGNLNTGIQAQTNLVRQAMPNNYGWNLIGNPYPSAFDWDEADIDYRMNNAIYFRETNGAVASYVNNVGTPYGTNGIIPAKQAFWVQVNISHSMGSITLNNNGRLHDALPLYKDQSGIELIRLKADNGIYTDETVIYFDFNAQALFNKDRDAVKFHADNPNIPSIFSYKNNNEELAINAINFEHSHIAIPIGYKSANTAVQHKITAFDFQQIDPNISIHLEDLMLNTLTNLRQDSIYEFVHNNSYSNNRFVLHFNMNVSDTQDDIQNEQEQVHIYASENNIYINFSSPTIKTYQLNVYNLLGQVVFSDVLNEPSGLHKFSINTNNGYYMVSLSTDNTVYVQKLSLFR